MRGLALRLLFLWLVDGDWGRSTRRGDFRLQGEEIAAQYYLPPSQRGNKPGGTEVSDLGNCDPLAPLEPETGRFEAGSRQANLFPS